VTGWRDNNDFTLLFLKCFFSDNSCQNWTIIEHNVPIYGVSIWSSRIVDLGLMTSLMTSSRIIIIDTKRATSQTSLPVSFTEVLVSFNRCAQLRYLHRLILASKPRRLPACLSYGSLWDFLTFFLNRPGGQGRAFWGKNCNFLKPLTLRPPKPPKFAQFWSGQKIFTRFRA